MNKDYKRAFTLLEIIMCLCIIALLTALATPVFINAKRASKAVVSKARLKQVHAAVSLYRMNHDDQFPTIWDIYLYPVNGPFEPWNLHYDNWISGCDPHPYAAGPREAFAYIPWELSEVFMKRYEQYGEQLILLYDDKCSDPSVNLRNQFEKKRGIGILTNGTIIDKTATGILDYPEWWVGIP